MKKLLTFLSLLFIAIPVYPAIRALYNGAQSSQNSNITTEVNKKTNVLDSLEKIRNNATDIYNTPHNNKAMTRLKTAMNTLSKQDKSSWRTLKQYTDVLLNAKAKGQTDAYNNLMTEIANIINEMAENQIITLQEKASFLAQQEEIMAQYIESLKQEVDAGALSPENASEKAAMASANLAKQKQELAVSSSLLGRIGSSLASPFQWVGSKIFDENTDNLKRAAYTVGVAATAIALGAAGYYARQTPVSASSKLLSDIKTFGSNAAQNIQEAGSKLKENFFIKKHKIEEFGYDTAKKIHGFGSDVIQDARNQSPLEIKMGSRAFNADNTPSPINSESVYNFGSGIGKNISEQARRPLDAVKNTYNRTVEQARRPFNAVGNAIAESTKLHVEKFPGTSGIPSQQPTTPEVTPPNATITDMAPLQAPDMQTIETPAVSQRPPVMTGAEGARLRMRALTKPTVPNFP